MDNTSLTEQDVAERTGVADDSYRPVRRRRSWRALAIAGVMAMLAAVGGVHAWQRRPHRRRRSP